MTHSVSAVYNISTNQADNNGIKSEGDVWGKAKCANQSIWAMERGPRSNRENTSLGFAECVFGQEMLPMGGGKGRKTGSGSQLKIPPRRYKPRAHCVSLLQSYQRDNYSFLQAEGRSAKKKTSLSREKNNRHAQLSTKFPEINND